MTDIDSVSFTTVISALLDAAKPFPPQYLHRFSDLSANEVADLSHVWKKLMPIVNTICWMIL